MNTIAMYAQCTKTTTIGAAYIIIFKLHCCPNTFVLYRYSEIYQQKFTPGSMSDK